MNLQKKLKISVFGSKIDVKPKLGVSLLSILSLGTALAADPATSHETSEVPHAVKLGIDQLVAQGFAPLIGKQVGLVTNQTGVDSQGRSTADLLAHAPGVRLMALFSPEHGIRGNQQGGAVVGDSVDSRTHVPVYSLYGTVKKPTPEMLNALDVIVFDMQDVGSRFYTYLTTMGLCMEAASRRRIGFMVLDRPNPLGGDIVEGQVLDPRLKHFTAYYTVPVRHGFTAGELAQWYNQAAQLRLNLQVITMAGWNRKDLWDQTGLRFSPPSPNIKTPTAALLYAGIGMFEATNLSVGRGTDMPFEKVGAPWLNGAALVGRLNQAHLPGVNFIQTTFTPTSDLYAGQLCSGARIVVTDLQAFRPVDLFVWMALYLKELSPKDFQPRWDEVARVTGSSDFEKMYKDNTAAAEIVARFKKSADDFRASRTPFLLY